MRLAIVALVCVGALVAGEALAEERSRALAWRQFKDQFSKSYTTKEEEARRFAIFLETLEQIELHNANASVTYKMGLNRFSDRMRAERASLNGAMITAERAPPSDEHSRKFLEELLNSDAPVPDEVDWRKVPNRVSSVKAEGDCHASYAFSTVGLLEGQQVVRNVTKKLVELSRQNLVDCSCWNHGCDGDPAWSLYEMAHVYGGIEKEADYPYTGDNAKKCLMDKKKTLMKVKGGIRLPFGDEEGLKKVVATYGPVSAIMDSANSIWDYESGVYDATDCNDFQVNHSVLIVGYGTDPKGGDYWIVKNSYGTDVFEHGYVRMKRGKNLCGIASFPLIATF